MLNSLPKLVLATSNKGKLAELRQMLEVIPAEILSLTDFCQINEVAETGATFTDNAILKATGYAQQIGLPTLADDSGLEIDALDGRPGVHSARYGGNTNFVEKMALVLNELSEAGRHDRRARFVSSIAIADANGTILRTVEGACTGVIAELPRGNGGFGYDPIFIPDGFHLTFGELSESIKGQISHRARAFSRIMPYLRDFYSI